MYSCSKRRINLGKNEKSENVKNILYQLVGELSSVIVCYIMQPVNSDSVLNVLERLV